VHHVPGAGTRPRIVLVGPSSSAGAERLGFEIGDVVVGASSSSAVVGRRSSVGTVVVGGDVAHRRLIVAAGGEVVGRRPSALAGSSGRRCRSPRRCHRLVVLVSSLMRRTTARRLGQPVVETADEGGVHHTHAVTMNE
jgi:hypothetical protein